MTACTIHLFPPCVISECGLLIVSGIILLKISIVNEILKGNNIGWNFAVNPLDINRTGKERGYHDYHNPQVREAINSLRIKENGMIMHHGRFRLLVLLVLEFITARVRDKVPYFIHINYRYYENYKNTSFMLIVMLVMGMSGTK